MDPKDKIDTDHEALHRLTREQRRALEAESPAQKLRALIAWLGIGERPAALQLGISRAELRGIMSGTHVPSGECKLRILAMSRRWPHGDICVYSWPEPPEPKRRGPKTAAK